MNLQDNAQDADTGLGYNDVAGEDDVGVDEHVEGEEDVGGEEGVGGEEMDTGAVSSGERQWKR